MSEPTKLIDRAALAGALYKLAESEIDDIKAEDDEDPGYSRGYIDALYDVAARLRDGRLP